MLEINKKGISIEKLFVVIGLIVGFMFIYIIPPFQSPDEDSHFKKAYSIANGNLYAKSENKTIGLEIPEAMNDYINNKLSMMGNRELKYSYNDFYYDQYLTNDLSKTSFYRVSTSETSPSAHLIPGIGILIAKLFGLIFFKGNPSIAFMLSFARFFSLLSYLTIGYFAIKLTPAFKKSFFAVLLMPMSIFLGSMVTYDNLLISITALAVASILKLTYDKKEKFNNKWFIIFAVIGYILLNVKVIYAPILGLMLFIPNERFKNKDKKEKWKTYLLLGTVIILATILLKIPNLLLESTKSSDLYSKQLQYVLSHPLSYTKILLNNIRGQLIQQLYWMVGTFGLLDTYLPPLFMFISFINLIIVFITDGISEKIKINYKQKIIVLLSFILGVVGMYTAMYLYWTVDVLGEVGGNAITGVQGRYFIPLLISLPLLFSNSIFNRNKKIFNFSKEYFNYSILIIIICLTISMLVSITRFWI